MLRTQRTAAMRLARQKGVVRWRAFAAQGIAPVTVARLVEEGQLMRVARGLYKDAATDWAEHESLIEAAVACPHGVIALLSSLRLHGLTTQAPHVVWMLIDNKARAPASSPVRLRIVRASGAALTAGVVEKELDGAKVNVTNPAKTVADCFKYRRRVGLDVAIEALREGLQYKAFTPDELLAMARVDRVEKVARPYLEALV